MNSSSDFNSNPENAALANPTPRDTVSPRVGVDIRPSNRLFWASVAAGALLVTIQSVALYGPLGVPLGLGTGASLGMVVYYLGAMIASAARWIRQQLQRP